MRSSVFSGTAMYAFQSAITDGDREAFPDHCRIKSELREDRSYTTLEITRRNRKRGYIWLSITHYQGKGKVEFKSCSSFKSAIEPFYFRLDESFVLSELSNGCVSKEFMELLKLKVNEALEYRDR